MTSLGNVAVIARLQGVELPTWLLDAIEEAVDRILELEAMVVGADEDNEEMFAALKFYATQPKGARARRIVER